MTNPRANAHRLRPTAWGWQYRTAGIIPVFDRFKVIEPDFSMAPEARYPMMTMLNSDAFCDRPTVFNSIDEAMQFADELADATIAVGDEIDTLMRARR